MTTPVPAQTVVRRNVYAKGGTFDNPDLLWYAKGIAAMQQRRLAEPVSWRFYAAIHGVDQQTSDRSRVLGGGARQRRVRVCRRSCGRSASTAAGTSCRGTAAIFWRSRRSSVRRSSPPADPADWALPYWNYFEAGQAALPPAFTSAPAGRARDQPAVRRAPLRVEPPQRRLRRPHRHQSPRDGRSPVRRGRERCRPGFGGVHAEHLRPRHVPSRRARAATPTTWSTSWWGSPTSEAPPGLMSNPDTAALDPIFWLHHANIDRLWEAWRRATPSHADPTASRWLHGPTDRRFIMPLPGGTTWTYTPADVDTLTDLHYSYEDLPKARRPPPPSHCGCSGSAGVRPSGKEPRCPRTRTSSWSALTTSH